ncbi:cysteine hydrolase [Amphritea opalescens]|uniref:Cysteine hydrolase n=1 Tax=Amphritea opalescens TaxID=2490544 RepID=A0A430KTC1_9GAMM|nr:cysteine hydrolase family protein [Amphritea opalescens]RTE66762.1 cysteine hydrolase [Amphritea opalescens]
MSQLSNTALLLIDFQNDYFPGGKWELHNIDATVANGAALLTAFRQEGLPVIHVYHEFEKEDAPFFLPNSDGAKIYPAVTPIEGETVILKHSANAFKNTTLQESFDALGVENLIVAGAMSNICIDAGVRAAADLGYNVTVAHDACTTRDQVFNGVTVPAQQTHAAFMTSLSFAYARLENTKTLLTEIS